MDEGRKIADAKLAKLERKIQKEYKKALKEMQEKADKYFKRFEEKDARLKAKVESGEMDEDEYLTWRRNKILSGKYYTDMVNSLSQDLSNARQNAQNIIREELPDLYAESANWGAYEIEKGLLIDTAFNLVDRNTVKDLLTKNDDLLPKPKVDIPKEMKWNKSKIRSALLQGIVQGEAIPKLAKRLQGVAEMSRSAAIRNARTMATGAENRGRVDSYKRAEKLGIKLHQRWVAVHDGRTRTTHRQIDGELQKVGDRFSNGCRFPGDPLGAPGEVYNCRCTLVADLDKYSDDYYSNFKEVDGISYEEWKEAKPVYKSSKTGKKEKADKTIPIDKYFKR